MISYGHTALIAWSRSKIRGVSRNEAAPIRQLLVEAGLDRQGGAATPKTASGAKATAVFALFIPHDVSGLAENSFSYQL